MKYSKKPLSPAFLYFLYVCQGVGVLFPWNTLITTGVFYKQRLVDLPFAESVVALFCIVFITVKLLFFILSSLIVHLISPENQVIYTAAGNSIIFLCLTVLTSFDQLDSTVFLVLTIILVFLASLCSAFSQNGLYTILGRYSPRYTQAISNGQGMAGVLTCIVKIITVYIVGSTQPTTIETVMYYSVSTIVQGVCWALFVMFYKSPLDPSIEFVPDSSKEVGLEKNEKNDAPKSPFMELLREYFIVFKEIQVYAYALFLNFFVTLGVFPSFLICTKSTTTEGFYFITIYPFMNFLIFNLGDWIGKSMPLWNVFTIKSSFVMLVFSLVRFVYFPLHFFGNVFLFSGEEYPLPKSLASDALFYIINLTLGITNGYLATLTMMYGPPAVSDPKYRSRSGSIMVGFLMFGLTAGVYMALVLNLALGV